jgi:hypothetical protein
MSFIYGGGMAQYEEYSYDQGKFMPVYFNKQISSGISEIESGHVTR